MSRRSQFVALLATVMLIAVAAAPRSGGSRRRQAAPAPAIGAFTVLAPASSHKIPGDIQGGAPNATLTQAATFAWNEFIAATWPAQPNGSGYNRDTPDPNGVYGKTAGSASGAPLVWETFRHKVEIFPGSADGTSYLQNTPPHGSSQGPPDYGYNDPPQYNYASGQVTGPCSGLSPSAPTAWVNADENSQIFLDTMYAGTLPGQTGTASQEILFLAKGNKVQYQYLLNPAHAGAPSLIGAFWNHGGTNAGNAGYTVNPYYQAAVTNFQNFQKQVLVPSGQTPTLTPPYITFPAGTIEAKSAWRPLTSSEANSGRYHMATVRFYLNPTSGVCYQQQAWGMIALHIIQKTPTAPYFIYATFSQADNILTAAGKQVEDSDGNIINTPDQPSTGSALDTGINSVPNPDKAVLAVPSTTTASGYETYNSMPQCKPRNRLYLVNAAGQYTPQGPICVNARAHPIPQEIINVNAAAHRAIRAYNAAHNLNRTPWLSYKLVNVQAVPMTKQPGSIYTGPGAATYYQSNDVVETNYNLQFFSGRLVVNPSFGQLMSDYVDPTLYKQRPSTPYQNVFFLKPNPKNPQQPITSTYLMGGCMGCHGNAQQAADDFSFITNVGLNDAPDPLPEASVTPAMQAQATAAKIKKFGLR